MDGGALARRRRTTRDKVAEVASMFLSGPAPTFATLGSKLAAQAFIGISDNVNHYRKGSGVDIHSVIGKLPAPQKGWTLPGHNYTGPYNPLDQQLKYDPETGEILEIYQQPSGATDAVAMQHDV